MKWFLALTEIPHPTFDCKNLSDKIVEWIKKMGVSPEQDLFGNICVRINAHELPDDSPVVSIQAHIDMVWVGEYVDGRIDVSYEAGKVIAKKSTLGADDGFGVAMILQFIEERNSFPHGPMELILTVDEEQGLQGVKKLPKKNGSSDQIRPFSFKYLINCDSLSGDKVYIGAAGGEIAEILFALKSSPLSSSQSLIKIDIDNLSGGHSGGCIHLGRANGTKLIVRLLNNLIDKDICFQLSNFQSGVQMNLIPTHSTAIIAVDSSSVSDALFIISEAYNEIIKEFKGIENPDFSAQKIEAMNDEKVFNVDDTRSLLTFLTLVSVGPLRMSPLFPTIVDTSQNLGVVRIDVQKNNCIVHLFCRSATQTKIIENTQVTNNLLRYIPLQHTVIYKRASVAWPPDDNNKLAKMMQDAYSEENGVRKEIGLLHVTIEPPEFNVLGYDAEMISVCPSIPMAHCIGEWMDVEEAMKWRNAVCRLLSKIRE
ncbi:aminoacyl-histidine dipeptidase [Histomonas meleagridis]|uniref:aminoacyl-histidine dipeptidase n=1 Tax=Histomonas meleagridis TaxID=135588 RepID=UPI00355ACB65|nr:aminoacyl-histidine dipeptidase [Histomonas meleagridis]KAH0806414.1 aminoacyl-histidine dipeptidase [Histomonas meleagridis]